MNWLRLLTGSTAVAFGFGGVLAVLDAPLVARTMEPWTQGEILFGGLLSVSVIVSGALNFISFFKDD
jgi:hypothetical protein